VSLANFFAFNTYTFEIDKKSGRNLLNSESDSGSEKKKISLRFQLIFLHGPEKPAAENATPRGILLPVYNDFRIIFCNTKYEHDDYVTSAWNLHLVATSKVGM
jgi:hypothetical protein